MINTLKYKIYSLLNSKCFRFLLFFALMFLLSGCEDRESTSASTAAKDSEFTEQISCWQIWITHAVTKVTGDLYNSSVGKVAQGGANLVLIAFAVWMAFKLLKVLGSFKEENLGEVLTEIIQKGVLCAACAYIVSNDKMISYAINTFVVPIYQAIIDLCMQTIQNDEVPDDISLGVFGKLNFASIDKPCPLNAAPASIDQIGKPEGGINIVSDCMVCKISARLSTGIQIALNLIVSMHISAFFIGIILLIAFTAAKFFFVLFLVDSLFRLNFAVYLLPVLIMGIPFNYTRKWSKHGLLMFLNSSGIMFFTGLMISAVVRALQEIVKGESYGYEDFEGLGISMLVILLLAVILFKIPALGVAMADKFIGGGGGMEFQKKVQGFVMNSVKKAGAFVFGGLTSGVSSVITSQMEKHEATRELLSNLREKKNSLVESLRSIGGYNEDD